MPVCARARACAHACRRVCAQGLSSAHQEHGLKAMQATAEGLVRKAEETRKQAEAKAKVPHYLSEHYSGQHYLGEEGRGDAASRPRPKDGLVPKHACGCTGSCHALMQAEEEARQKQEEAEAAAKKKAEAQEAARRKARPACARPVAVFFNILEHADGERRAPMPL